MCAASIGAGAPGAALAHLALAVYSYLLGLVRDDGDRRALTFAPLLAQG
jgi:hypothetical protein